MPPKKRTKTRGSQETERMFTRARSPEVHELSCVPEPQQATGVEVLVEGVEDPLKMSATKQGEIGLETQYDWDTSDEDTQATQAAGGTQKGKGKGKGKAGKRSKKPLVLFTTEQQQKIVDFLCANENLYNKRLMDYKREALWDKFCENNLNKDACQKWFQSQHTLFGKVTHIKSGQGERQLTERQKWTRDNFDFLSAPSYSKKLIQSSQGVCFSSQCSSGFIIQMGDCVLGTIPRYFSSRVNL